MKSLQSTGMDTLGIRQLDSTESQASDRTAQYVAVNGSDKDMFVAIADMKIFQDHEFPGDWDAMVTAAGPKWLAVDACWNASGIRHWIKAAKKNGAKVAFEPVSRAKSMALFSNRDAVGKLQLFPSPSVDLSSPNQHELEALYEAAEANGYFDDPQWSAVVKDLDTRGVCERLSKAIPDKALDIQALQKAIHLLPYIPTIITKVGANGAVLLQLMPREDSRLEDASSQPFIIRSLKCNGSVTSGIYARFFPRVEEVDRVVSVNGVGDTFLGVLLAGLANGRRVEDLIDVGQKGAVMTLKSPESVSSELYRLKGELL